MILVLTRPTSQVAVQKLAPTAIYVEPIHRETDEDRAVRDRGQLLKLLELENA